MKIFQAVAKFHAGADEKHEINFHWPYVRPDTEILPRFILRLKKNEIKQL